MIADSYATAVRDETWVGGVLVESCLSHGEAQRRGTQIVATDRLRDPALRRACDEEAARVHDIVREIDARVRVVVRATSDESVTSTIGITIGDVSIVTTPQFAIEDAAALRLCPVEDSRPRLSNGLPLVWHNGSGSILMHEAAGHAAEHHHAPLDLPEWLHVKIGFAARRESFRDVPLQRMTEVVLSQEGAPFVLPDRCINIYYVAGGAYEPLSETVTIEVAVPRLTIRATRSAIARSIVGAAGDPTRYPGVICSREGQELFVGSYAPLIVTAGLL